MHTQGLDLLHFFTLPGFSWQAALKYTGQKLELIRDREMYDFIQKAMRGGISTIITRYAKGNNKYMDDQYNPNEPSSFIKYLDANNLYDWAMSKALPVGGFKWLSEEELDLPISEIPPCFIKVDLEYPKELHDKFSELVPAPDRIIPEGSKVDKLAPNLLPKKGYVCHIENLKLYVNLGVKLTKVHTGVKFIQKAWLKSFIDLNTELRIKSTNNADKDMFKLLNNAVFGKTCENLFERTDLRLVTTRKQALKLVTKPQFKHYTVYDETSNHQRSN